MKTLEYVKEHLDEFEKDNFIDRRFTKRFLNFLPVEEWSDYKFEYIGNDEFVQKEWTEENILEQLKVDVSFGIEKAINHRGISAELMQMVVIAWCKVLENGLENSEYGYYGHKTFKAVDDYYKWGLVTDNTFDDSFFEEW